MGGGMARCASSIRVAWPMGRRKGNSLGNITLRGIGEKRAEKETKGQLGRIEGWRSGSCGVLCYWLGL